MRLVTPIRNGPEANLHVNHVAADFGVIRTQKTSDATLRLRIAEAHEQLHCWSGSLCQSASFTFHEIPSAGLVNSQIAEAHVRGTSTCIHDAQARISPNVARKAFHACVAGQSVGDLLGGGSRLCNSPHEIRIIWKASLSGSPTHTLFLAGILLACI